MGANDSEPATDQVLCASSAVSLTRVWVGTWAASSTDPSGAGLIWCVPAGPRWTLETICRLSALMISRSPLPIPET
jgi:hypothetical protein